MTEQLRQIYDDLSSGRLSREAALEKIKALKLRQQPGGTGVLLFTPVWEPDGGETSAGAGKLDLAEHHVILCELADLDLPYTSLHAGHEKNIAQRYGEYALACFERIQAILRSKPEGRVLLQIVVADGQERAVLAGLSGLLKTAALENPLFAGQLVLVPADVTAEDLGRYLEEEKSRGLDPLVRYERGVRQVFRWQEVQPHAEKTPVAFKDDGVYLITGGLGGLGLLFAREILERTREARLVLTGRSPWSSERESIACGLSAEAGRVSYRQLNLVDRDEVSQLIQTLNDEYGRLNGIVHCAGTIADDFIIRKSSGQFSEVLAPKVVGTYNLDRASQDVALDFFVLFSSVAGAMGNPGQADYAAANGFMDQFAAYRNGLVAARQRQGQTRSINWPLWQSGGMSVDPANLQLMQQATGMQPLRTADGLRAFHRSLAWPCHQMLVAEGDPAQIRHAVLAGRPIQSEPSPLATAPEPPAAPPTGDSAISAEDLAEKTEEYLCRECSGLLKLPAHDIEPQAALEQYGIDSILALKLTNQLEKTFGPLSKTLFFEYRTIRELTGYFVRSHAARLATLFPATQKDDPQAALVAAPPQEMPAPVRSGRSSRRRVSPRNDAPVRQSAESEPIAIIGLSGRYPEAVDVGEFWLNLREGKDCIIEVPKERWDWREYYSSDRTEGGHHYSKWGGFIAGVDEFDPLFFNISPKEAKFIDPQERLFLQHAWMAVEDAGYTRASLQIPSRQELPGQVGVYVGVMFTEYQLFGAEANARGKHMGVASSGASIANRVSYVLNLHGPSVTLDTMCSSSLTAIHFACMDLKQGQTDLAIAGGVNVSIHPNKYLVLSAGQFISSDGHCQSFGEGGDGYIPGEGVGAVILKRLSDAERDGDHIYGVIRGSALNHGGKTNGYTVPNPQAQAGAISRALSESRVDARHLSYIEAHGTGTKLGDPIEIAALAKAFQPYTQETGFCLIGSAKSNIGHCESAAGIAGLTKVLLQMQHQQIVPSLHSAQLNPHIDFASSPFVVNQTLRPWEQPVIDGRPVPRIAGLSSFGAGGSNAHLIVEEYQAPAPAPLADAPAVILLSARTLEQLQQKARELLEFVRASRSTIDLASMAYTLQVGREAMDERLGFVVSSVDELAEKLDAYVAGQQTIEEAYSGQVKRNREALAAFKADVDLKQTVGKWIADRKLSRLADLWVKGLELDWRKLYGEPVPRRMSLPTYPFAREHYWVDVEAAAVPASPQQAATAVLHPLLHTNTSDLSQQSYSSTLTGEQLTPAAYFEMARAAVDDAASVSQDTFVELRDVKWVPPVALSGEMQVDIALLASGNDRIDFEIYTGDAVLCQGRAVLSREPAPAKLALEQLGSGLTRLRPAGAQDTGYVLHPALLDSALQAAVGLAEQGSGQRRQVVALDTLRVIARCQPEMIAWVRPAAGTGDAAVVDVDLCDDRGNVAAQLRGVRSEAASAAIAESFTEAVASPAIADTPVVAPLRREIAFGQPASATPPPSERKKPAAISLAAPNALVSPAGKAVRPVGRTPITLPSAAPASALRTTSPMRLYDDGQGLFSIQIPSSIDAAQLREALERVRQEPALKVLTLRGLDRAFADGGPEAHNAAVERQLYRAIVSFPYPTIAVLDGETIGAGFMAASLCDFMVCSEEAVYGYTDPLTGLYPTAAEARLFSERFGAGQAQELLYQSVRATGRELRSKGWTCPILPPAEVESHAQQLASTCAAKSQDALRILKQHLARQLVELVRALSAIDVPAEELESPVETVLVVTIDATNLAEAFERIGQSSGYQAIVLASDELEFLAAIGEAAALELRRMVTESDIPVVAALTGDARGNAWLVAAGCDACVYSRTGEYSAARLALTDYAAAIFTGRFGNDAGREILLSGSVYRGAELQRRIPTVRATDAGDVLAAAMAVAESWAKLPRGVLTDWKRYSAAVLQAKPRGGEWSHADESSEVPSAPVNLPLRSNVVTAILHPDGVVVVTMEDRQAKNMFSDAFIEGVKEAFASIAVNPSAKVVVLTGYDSYFASGGTKESLLAIQEGKLKFTDAKIFQLPLECRLPVIAAMQGHGLGAGWTLGMFADLVLLGEESRYVSPYMNYGFTPGAGATWILAEKLGQDLSRESLLTAQPYTGSELKERGVALPVLPRNEVVAAAMVLAGRIARPPRGRLLALKHQFTASLQEVVEEIYRLELAMHEQTFVGQAGALARIETNFHQEAEPPAVRTEPIPQSSGSDIIADVESTLRTLLANELQMRESDIDGDTQFVDLGLDSIAGVSWLRKINQKYRTAVEATRIYSYPTLVQLSRHVAEEAEKQGTVSRAPAPPVVAPVVAKSVSLPEITARPAPGNLTSRRSRTAPRFTAAAAPPPSSEPIAIIGMAGQFPQARNLTEYWENIASGRDCITEVPPDRWDLSRYYHPGTAATGKTNSRWMGALDEYAIFDPLFFNISPREAEFMDPQQRVFLQACWLTIEHAGYSGQALSGSKCGVFVGCAVGDYHLLSRVQQLTAEGFTGDASSILAARISYFMNLRGPCVSIDTACSSSLVAIAQACDSLTTGSSELALAGGVYVMAGPEMHVKTAQSGMLSPEGRCFTFDQRADGMVLGEGVGVVLLKRLSDARRDGDMIHAVIHGWGVNQDGKTNGITAPNPESQTRLEQEVYDRYQIDPAGIQLVEAHGTGTKLGDPIEVEGLKKAFQKYTSNRAFCALGSVKSNIGHTLTAAGIAGVHKLVLALKHKQLPPTINFERLNEHIDLTDSPFYVNTQLREWKLEGAATRQAAVSSFAFSGTNAHLVIGEYQSPADAPRPVYTPVPNTRSIVPLSARTAEQLQQKAADLLAFLRSGTAPVDLAELAYTLQVGREPMEERLGFVVSSIAELVERLEAYGRGEARGADVHRGDIKGRKAILGVLGQDDDLKKTVVEKWIAEQKLSRLLELWVNGVELDWNRFYGEVRPRRIELPLYPFAKERYWIDAAQPAEATTSRAAAAVLHPLVHVNASDLHEQRYRSAFTGHELFLADHQVKTSGTAYKVLPAVAYLEMARAAVEQAMPGRAGETVLELHNVVWAQPVVVSEAKEINIALVPREQDQVDYEIYSGDGDEEIVHGQGLAILAPPPAPERLDLAKLESEMGQERWEQDRVYDTWSRMGLAYGPSFRTVRKIRGGTGQLLAQLRLTSLGAETDADYVLHPAMMDGALQACVRLISSEGSYEPRLPFALETLRLLAPCTAEMVVWARYARGVQAGDSIIKLDLDLCDSDGNVCVQLRGLSTRPLGREIRASAPAVLLATPVWRSSAVEAPARASSSGVTEHHVLLCGLSNAATLSALLSNAHCDAVETRQDADVAQRYAECALAAFERIQSILQRRPSGRVLFQIVAATGPEQSVLAGLSALLETAALENPQIAGQVILVPAQTAAEELAELLKAEKAATDPVVRYGQEGREILRWEEAAADTNAAPVGFRDDGVYLITGGTGGLGLLFTREILERTTRARIVWTGRSGLSAEKQALLDGLSAQNGRVSYRPVDLGDRDQVAQLIAGMQADFGAINGILHLAGMFADNFILRKSRAEFSDVLAPKVAGTLNLDLATTDVDLDFFVLFSSFAAVMGNVGQADYAAANAFMDHFAVYRNGQVEAGRRRGRTRSIDWPLWQAGGMAIDSASRELLQQTFGVRPMQTATGMQAFYRSLELPFAQVLVAEGDLAQMRTALFARRTAVEPEAEVAATAIPADRLAEKTLEYLRKELAGLLKLPAHRIDPQAALEKYGMDSILALKLTNRLEETFGSLSKTLFFEYQTIGELTQYFVASHSTRLSALLVTPGAAGAVAARPEMRPAAPAKRIASRRFARSASVASPTPAEAEAIAIIGLSGRYPEAVDLDAYWANLRDGKDCIVEVPKERWDWREYYSEDRTEGGRHFSKWGGFIVGVDEFDPLFFNISRKEAKFIDPQERLFLQHAWKAIEDAGYTRAALQVGNGQDLPGQAGVYVGVMYSEYQLFGVEATLQGNRMGVAGSAASIANRVSYALNLHGPSMTLDTMCSSSLTAIHLACQDLKLGRTSLAIAGGVNVTIHPNKYLVLSAGQFISSDGHCQSFGEGGDGYIPGEGVGVVVLKRLSEAKRDGDHIYGIVRGSALNHGGKTNGYTVPNPQAQAAVISRALADSNLDPRHVSYVEAHGTGTKLGDPIEIAALSKAFQYQAQDAGCLIGSAKSNIGHCESAAGIAGLTKVLLQLEHRQIVPSLHSAQLNPHIDFEATPFVVNQALRDWEPPVVDGRVLPRIAGISSFGAGGSNAHILIEEYESPVRERLAAGNVAILLSARTAEQLQQKARELLDFVQARVTSVDLVAMAFTLQVGREAMEERLGLVVSTAEELVQKLGAYLAGDEGIEDVYSGKVRRDGQSLSAFSTDADLQETVEKWIAQEKLPKLLDLWAKGLDLDWGKLYGEVKPPRISLPTYPFARERFWIDVAPVVAVPPVVAGARALNGIIHPLVHSNASDPGEQRYRSTFTGDEFFIADPQVTAGSKVLPAVAYLEMARAAIEHAFPAWRQSAVLELRDTLWGEPAVIDGPKQVAIALIPNGGDEIEYEIYSDQAGRELVHCHGRALVSREPVPAPLDLEYLKARGGADQVLAELRLPPSLSGTSADYVLHPAILEGTLQAAVALVGGASPRRLFALEALRIFAPCAEQMVAWVRHATGSRTADPVVRVDIDLCDERGGIAAQLRGVSLQVPSLAKAESASPVLAEALVAAPVRRELVFATAAPATPAAGERKKPAAISLAMPNALAPAAGNESRPAGRVPITLSNAAPGLPLQTAAAPSVRSYDDGRGIFSIDIVSPMDAAAQLRLALDRVQQEATLKVLTIRGLGRAFAGGGRDAYNEAVGQQLYRAVVSFPYPVIAVLEGETIGAGFMAAALCDFMVCSEEAEYGFTDPRTGLYPTAAEANLLSARFGAARAQDLLYSSMRVTGRELRAKGWTCPIVPAAQVETHAQKLAATLASKSRDALRLLKEHLTRQLVEPVRALSPIEMFATEKLESPVLVVTDPAEAVEQIHQSGDARAIVLAVDGDIDDELAFELLRLVTESEIPVIAALTGDARGNTWLLAAACEAAVYSRTGEYSAAGLALTEGAAALFVERFGDDAAKEILLTGSVYRGAELQRRVPTLRTADAAQVLAAAVAVAESWAKLPPAVRRGRQHWSPKAERTPLAESAVHAQTSAAGHAGPPEASGRSPVTLRSSVVTATADADGVVVVKLEDRQAKNMFSDAFIDGIREVFAHIDATPAYKVVVLTGYDSYFASGGTKESLLAIQEGKIKFTDAKVFQLPLECRLPVIAAMQGHGIGAGWTLGMFSDLVLLSEESRYVSPYMEYGFTPGAGATWILAEKMGQDLARESLLTAQPYAGSDLKARGLALPILPRNEVLPAAMALARQIARQSRGELLALKHQFTASVYEVVDEIYRLELAMHEQTFVGHSDTLTRIQSNFALELDPAPAPQPQAAPVHASAEREGLPAVVATLKSLLANELLLREHEIDADIQFVDLGLDSISGVSWIRKINEKYQTAIEATKVYSYPTLAQLSRHVKEEAEKSGTLPTATAHAAVETVKAAVPPREVMAAAAAAPLASRRRRPSRVPVSTPSPSSVASQPIAIIGMAGQYPQAKNVEEFWENIAAGRDGVIEVPRERWDVSAYYQPGEIVPGKTNSPWLGALEEYDRFDPLFFNISPTEAVYMDPQQRLFLQACWHAIENAGYDARLWSGSRCGVFVGCATGDYHQLSRAHQLTAQGFTGTATSILAARISYFLNLQGPCVAVDTACSSSLVAIAQACDGLIAGDTDLALAGGVYVMAGPEMHIRTAQAGMLSPKGRCFTFDERADGFVAGEGVGVVVLKRLTDAERDGDNILGLIHGWGINQDGRTNGITAPNPESQTRLEQEVYDKYGIDPSDIQLVEAHGTGTKLGDPIEVEGLKNAFARYTQKTGYCALGSVKSNIGHTLTAAGVAGVIKLLLALRHKQLPPTINFERLNDHIDLSGSPFYVNTKLQEWQVDGDRSRQAAISSFGFSGTNVHMVIGEYCRPAAVARPVSAWPGNGQVIVPLSARTAEQLEQKARDLLAFLGTPAAPAGLVEIAYTLQVGRAAMDERLAFVVTSIEQLREKLQAWLDGGRGIQDVHQGQLRRNTESVSLISEDDEVRDALLERWIAQKKPSRLAAVWAKGLEIDWTRFYGEARPRRVSLPVYPFAKERYWIETTDADTAAQMRELTPPTFTEEVSAIAEPPQQLGTLLAVPAWQNSSGETPTRRVELAAHHVLLCELPGVGAETLQSLLPQSHCLSLQGEQQQTIAARYGEYALACFHQLQTILRQKVQGNVRVQVVVPGDEGQTLLAGLGALLKTAAQENPRLKGQLIVVAAETTAAELARQLDQERSRALDSMVRYEGGVRQVLRWEEVPASAEAVPVRFRDDGVYLITGGAGGLGILFAEEILTQAHAKVVLTGRSALDDGLQARLDGLAARAGEVIYRQVDLRDADAVKRLIGGIRDQHGRLDGVLHCAGVLAENLIVDKGDDEFLDVLAPKVAGTWNLDQATRDVELDFFVLFSSLAGAMGNLRTADYAAANAFLDQFAPYRNRLVAAGQRHGRTRSINWPVWQSGRMGTDAVSQERLQQATGMLPMRTAAGMQAFHRSLALPHDQLLVVEGLPAKIRSYVLQATPSQTAPAARPARVSTGFTLEQLQQRLQSRLASVLGMKTPSVDIDQAFMELGLDSFLGTQLMTAINKEYGTGLSHMSVFDYPTVRELARFLKQELDKLPVQVEEAPAAVAQPAPAPTGGERPRVSRVATARAPQREAKIAIVGMAGRYPQANNLQEFWDNLVHGRNSVVEVPASRWDAHKYYDPDPTKRDKANSKWLGAMDDVEGFDPLFFRISPQEADYIDPHHRLFLQESYRAFEDAGYSGSALANKKCGVYLGISSNEYALRLAKNGILGDSPVTSNHTAIAAARIAYYLNLKGPAISVDTACSSSLVAIHLACQALLSGETDMALAGGVSVWLTPESYLAMTQAGMLSSVGQCQAFDDSADGIVVGDGVGAVVLKRLEDAEADRDFIYGVILGSGINQDGRTNGITAPSISSQIELERSLYDKYEIDPATISYVEAHGTGTPLGDPIELEALATVFQEKTGTKNFCAVGSVKSNIGHTTSAAGVAGVHKVLLSMRHRTLVPTLHVTRENSRFDFSNSPFYISRETQAWEVAEGSLRRAAVSSFGFSGTNAHLVLEEYPMAGQGVTHGDGESIVPLSARTAEQLRQRARDLLAFLRTAEQPVGLASLAYTLQTGRDAMEERVGFVVRSIEELAEKLGAYLNGEREIDGIHQGRVEPGNDSMTLIGRDDDMQDAIEKWIAHRKLSKLLDLWTRGLQLDWNRLYDGATPQRIPLPTYPFARERHWVGEGSFEPHPERQLTARDASRSIEDIIDRIGDDDIDTTEAINALKMLV
jgi:acyl transferase domain-containing protein/enoyl-CoA hydratase/carnithine racemase/acyl carrier protein